MTENLRPGFIPARAMVLEGGDTPRPHTDPEDETFEQKTARAIIIYETIDNNNIDMFIVFSIPAGELGGSLGHGEMGHRW